MREFGLVCPPEFADDRRHASPVELMHSGPLFDASIDARSQAKTSKGVRPFRVTSVAEAYLLSTIVWFCLSCYAAEFWHYPRSPLEMEWFHWAPEAARHWMVQLALAVLLAASQTLFPLVLYLLLPVEWKRSVPLRFLPYGSPPLLGAAILVVITVLPIVLFGLLCESVAD